MTKSRSKFKIGDGVRVLWGPGTVEGEVIEVWGDPAQYVLVTVELGGPDSADEIVTLLLSPSEVELARPA